MRSVLQTGAAPINERDSQRKLVHARREVGTAGRARMQHRHRRLQQHRRGAGQKRIAELFIIFFHKPATCADRTMGGEYSPSGGQSQARYENEQALADA